MIRRSHDKDHGSDFDCSHTSAVWREAMEAREEQGQRRCCVLEKKRGKLCLSWHDDAWRCFWTLLRGVERLGRSLDARKRIADPISTGGTLRLESRSSRSFLLPTPWTPAARSNLQQLPNYAIGRPLGPGGHSEISVPRCKH